MAQLIVVLIVLVLAVYVTTLYLTRTTTGESRWRRFGRWLRDVFDLTFGL